MLQNQFWRSHSARRVASLAAGWLCLGLFVITLAGCGDSGPPRKETSKVLGRVMVDGSPAGMLQIKVHDEAGMDKEMPTESSCLTEEDGTFQLNTYVKGDGVPPGKYKMT